MLLAGAELPALWAVVFLAALAESALHYLSWSRLEDKLGDQSTRERYAGYLEHTRAMSALCVAVRIVAVVAMVAFIAVSAGDQPGRLLPSMLMAGAMVLLAELTARLIGRRWSAAVLGAFLPVLYWAVLPLRLLVPGSERPDQQEAPEPGVVEAAKEEIRVAIEDGAVEGALEAEEKEMIEGILKFRQVDVAQVMTPRTEIESLEADTPLPEALEKLEAFHHSRVPVYDETLDKVMGIVYVKDLLSAAREANGEGKTLRDVMREPFFTPETRTLGPLLQHFQDEHVQIAIVLDEYGGVSGVISVEDIMEEIVGEIEDEYDEEDQQNRVRLRSSGGIVADARVRIDELNEEFGLDIPEDEGYDTIGGYVTSCFARVPEPGEEFRTDGLLIRVLQSDPRRVRRIFLKRFEDDETD
ncbi:MAG: hemolysin family protein [Candidatus Brocadiia bacterium]